MADLADSGSFDTLSTEELRTRAFGLARERRDMGFFWNLIRLLPHADDVEMLDNSSGAIGAAIDDVIALWRDFTGHSYGTREPIIRAAFIDYLTKYSDRKAVQ